MKGRYEGPALDATYQYITERPSLEDEAEDIVYATDPEPEGVERTEGCPIATDGGQQEGQTTLDEWGWSR